MCRTVAEASRFRDPQRRSRERAIELTAAGGEETDAPELLAALDRRAA